jgi:hypothetical protein
MPTQTLKKDSKGRKGQTTILKDLWGQRIRHTPLGFAGEEEDQLKKMLNAGVIRPSVSEWASASVLIRKRCGSVRWCVDYRALNALTIKDVFPLPLVDECLDTLAGNVWYSKLDANSAYWQVKIKHVKRCTWWEIVVLVTALRHKSYTFWPTYHMLIAYTYYTKWQFWTINYSAHTLFCCLGAVVAVIVW